MFWLVLLVAVILSFLGGLVYAVVRLALVHNSPLVRAELEKIRRRWQGS